MKFIAIDQSTSATKALLFDSKGNLLDKVSLSHHQIYPQPGWVEHDANEIYSNTLQSLQLLLQKHQNITNQIICISITNQRETFVIFDRDTGEPITNAIVWQCRRGEEICSQLRLNGHESAIQEKTGLKIDTYFTGSKLKWLLDNRPEIKKKLENGSALFGTIDTYLIYRLTNQKIYSTDHTNASRTLFYDINRLNWSEELCQLFGISSKWLPPIRESADQFGKTDLNGLLKSPIPICGVIGDSQAALFAHRCFDKGDVKVTFGSGSSILYNIGMERGQFIDGILTTIGWVHNGNPTYSFEGITNFTGATISWLRDQIKLIDSFDEAEFLAKSIDDTEGVYLIPAFVGLSAPYWRSDVKASIVGMTPSTQKAHVVRAALESIAFVINDALSLIESKSGIEISIIHADGGATNNQFLMQFFSDISRLKTCVSNTIDLSAQGAVFFGGLGMKVYSSLEEIKNIPSDILEFTPLMELSKAKKLELGWHDVINHALSTS